MKANVLNLKMALFNLRVNRILLALVVVNRKKFKCIE